MKGAFESYLIIFFGMTFTLLGFSMAEITMRYNNARLYQESIVSLIERHNRYDDTVDQLIITSDQKCNGCSFSVNRFEDKYLVTVNFNFSISVLNYQKKAEIKSLTQSIV